MEELFNDIRHCRSFSFCKVEEAFGIELAKSTIKMLMKLNVKENEIFVYDRRRAILRYVTLQRWVGLQPFYGIQYRCYKGKPEFANKESVEIDGKFYELWTFWEEEDISIPNCRILQPCFANDIEPHYNYLRMELGKKPNDRKFSIMPWG